MTDVVAETVANLAAMGFEPPVCTRSNCGLHDGEDHLWFRIALVGPTAGDGASIEWLQSPAPRGQGTVRLSPLSLRLFRYLGDGGYALVERNIARWAEGPAHVFVRVIAAGDVADQYAELVRSAGDRAARPRWFDDTPTLLVAIDGDTEHSVRAWTAADCRMNRSGTRYVPWRTTFAAVHSAERQLRGSAQQLPRGFDVMPIAAASGPDA